MSKTRGPRRARVFSQAPHSALAVSLGLAALVLAPMARGAILAVYQNCDQPGPTPECQYHPYANTVSPPNTTMDMARQLQLSHGKAYGTHSASAFDVASGVLYFFQGSETTMYRVDARAHKLMTPVNLSTPERANWLGVAAARWDNASRTIVAVTTGRPRDNRGGGLVSIDPSSGSVFRLDSKVDPDQRVNGGIGKGGGLSAFGAGLLVFPQIPAWDYPHSFDVVNASTGVSTRVTTTMDILGLEYSDGTFWALGTLGPAPAPFGPDSRLPLIAALDPNTGAIKMVANLTAVVGSGPLRAGWEATNRRVCSAFDHNNSIMYFACDPNIVGVDVRTGKVVTSSPLVHWADGTKDSMFVNAMQVV